MQATPLLSVITAIYNRKHTLARAIASLRQQQFQDFEWIAVDDGSTDDSFEIVKAHASEFHHVQLIQKTHTGIADTWNTGIRAARGRWITFLDSDDAYLPDHLQIRVNYIQAHPEIDLLHSTATLVGKEEDFWVPDRSNPSRNIHLKDCAIGATFFMKRQVWETLDGFRQVLFPDADFLERAELRFRVVKIDAPTYVYFRNSSDSFLNKIKQQGPSSEKH